MVEDTGKMQWEHKWVFVIIPIQEGYQSYGPGYTQVPTTFPLFSAYCKPCDTYYTKRLKFDTGYYGMDGTTGLPRFGCVSPEGRF